MASKADSVEPKHGTRRQIKTYDLMTRRKSSRTNSIQRSKQLHEQTASRLIRRQRVKMWGIWYDALLDSGAVVNFINPHEARGETFPSKATIIAGDGHTCRRMPGSSRQSTTHSRGSISLKRVFQNCNKLVRTGCYKASM